MFEAMKKLTIEVLEAAMGEVMQKNELEAVMARRDVIIKHFEERIASRGEAAVLFTLERNETILTQAESLPR